MSTDVHCRCHWTKEGFVTKYLCALYIYTIGQFRNEQRRIGGFEASVGIRPH